MKKKILALSLIIAFALASLNLTGCGCSSSNISEQDAKAMEGTWELVAADVDGTKASAKDMGVSMSFVFNKNGKTTYTLDGETEEYKWSKDGDLITIYVPIEGGLGSSTGHTAVLDGDSFTLYWDYNGKPMQLYFAKKGSSAADPNKFINGSSSSTTNTTSNNGTNTATNNSTNNPEPSNNSTQSTASNANVIGRWNFTAAVSGGQRMGDDQLELFGCYLDFKDNGKVGFALYDQVDEYDYTVSGNTVSINDGTYISQGTVNGNEIALNNPDPEAGDFEQLIFTK